MTNPGRETHYEVLGVPRHATAEQIEKAYRFHKQMYDDVALATYTLLDPEEMRSARAAVNEAFDVLGNPQRRREYDGTFEVVAPERAVLSFPPAPVAAPVFLTEPVTGEALRKFREERGVSLRDIAVASKIGVRFLEYIEEDRHAQLPARVYLRSFLLEYAKGLGLDPVPTADAYIARMAGSEK